MIQTLERENRKWREKQRSIGNDIMANNDCMANINSIARCGTRPPSAVPTNQSTVPSQVALICFALYYYYYYYYYYPQVGTFCTKTRHTTYRSLRLVLPFFAQLTILL